MTQPTSTKERSPATSERVRRPATLATSSVAFVGAVIGVSVGVGLAGPHLAGGGSRWPGWLGLALLAVSVGLACWSAWRILHGVRRRWWVLAAPMILVVTYVTLWTVGQGVAAAFPPHPALGARTPADVGLTYRTVSVPTADGVDLAGWWVPSVNGAAVVLLHGSGSTRAALLDHASVLASHGYGVLLLDARGHGGSAGRGMDFGWYGEGDTAAAMDFVTAQTRVDPTRVGLLGLSMGGEEAIGAAGADPRVRAVVAEGATNRVAADKAYLAAYGVRGQLQRGIDWATYAVADVLSGAPKPAPLRDSVVAAQRDGTPTPLLLVTAGDVETERLAATRLAAAAPAAVDVWTVPGAGHTQGLRTAPREWERRVLRFFDGALGGEDR